MSKSREWTFEEKVMSFWDKVDRSAGPDQCWIWKGAITAKWGYGSFAIGGGETRGAHKVAWMLTNGDAKGLCVLHRCDNRVCVNPGHLYIGTKKDNSLDKAVRGRDSLAAFKAEQVREIRAMLGKVPQNLIAKRYGVRESVISALKLGHTYRWVT